jgi:flagellar biosynthetic protein FliR
MIEGYAEWFYTAFLMFIRIGGVIALAPYFSMASFPVRVKVFLSMALTFMMATVIPQQLIPIDNLTPVEILVAAFTEFLTGLAIGFAGQITISAVMFAAELMSVNIGLAFASILDPVNQTQQSVLAQLFTMLAVIVFLGLDGDHRYIQVMALSFERIPLQGGAVTAVSDVFLSMALALFVSGLQLAMPFLLFLFILDMAFAIFARIMPQANIFFIALPLKVGVGFLLILAVLPYAPQALGGLFNGLWRFLEELVLTLASG